MSATPSAMVSLGTAATDFSLPDVISGRTLNFADVRGDRATVVMFICNHCPFVKLLNDELVRLGHDYRERGVGLVAISPNDVDRYPEDSPERMAEVAKRLRYPFPYLYDETQEVARAYEAACTPDFFVYDADGRLAYRGQLDDARPGSSNVPTGRDLRRALEDILAGKSAAAEQIPSLGCGIKWKSVV
ncbi:MAG: thioredoxin family protein [Catalinimonas sp.]